MQKFITVPYLACSACLLKGLYVEFEMSMNEYISVAISHIITKFNDCVG